MTYRIIIDADVESNLQADRLRDLLQICLYDSESGQINLDHKNSTRFQVIDYLHCEVKRICEECNAILENRMIDVDGTNLVEREVCPVNESHFY